MSSKKARNNNKNEFSFKFLCFIVALNICGQLSENLAAPLWFNEISGCADPFIMFQIMILWYPVLFFFTSLFLMYYFHGEINWGRIFNRYEISDHIWIMSVGFFDALNGALVIPASPADRTPPIIVALLGGSLILPMILIKHYYMKYHQVPGYLNFDLYKSTKLIHCLIYVILSTYMMIYPTIVNGDDVSFKIYWWCIFFIGMCVGTFYNIQQERFFDFHDVSHLTDFVIYLTWETFYLLIWGYLMTPLNFIPNFGTATPDNVHCNYYDTFKSSFTTKAFGYNFMFNIGYYFAFIASCYINKVDALIGTASTIITNALLIIISYPVPELTPDKSVVQIGLLPITFILGSLATIMYTLWSKDKVVRMNGDTVPSSAGVTQNSGMLTPLVGAEDPEK